jgi:hypothetical protein
MLDVQERKRMMEAIIALLAAPQEWDAFDEYYSHLNTHDAAVYEIGWFFWECLDPEYPSNRKALSDSISFRSILFLLSAQEYQKRSGNRSRTTCGGDEYWPFPGKESYETERVENGRCADGLLLSVAGTKSA